MLSVRKSAGDISSFVNDWLGAIIDPISDKEIYAKSKSISKLDYIEDKDCA